MQDKIKLLELTQTQLTRQISLKKLTSKIATFQNEDNKILGQNRATEALAFGLGIEHMGFNLYVAGDNGSGRTDAILNYLKPIAAQGNVAFDWLYVNNFDDPRQPHYIRLPAGQGGVFLSDIDNLIEALLATFPMVFEHPSFLQIKTAINKAYQDTYDKSVAEIERAAATLDIAVFREDNSITFTPIIEGKLADEADFAQMNSDSRELFHQHVVNLEQQLNLALLELPQWQRDNKDKLRKLYHQTILQSLKPLFDKLLQAYKGHTGVHFYLAQMSLDLPKIIEDHLGGKNSETEEPDAKINKRKLLEQLYRPNLIVRADVNSGKPIVLEPNPTYSNLFGQINYLPNQGLFNTDFQQIIAGSLHSANGGYLVVEIEKILANANCWDALKRLLRQSAISIEQNNFENGLGLSSSLKPQTIPMNIKIILIGSHELYYNLSDLDPDFDELFRVLVDFSNSFPRNNENLIQFAHLLLNKSKRLNLARLSMEAIAKLAEYSCRLAQHQNKLSAKIDQIIEVMLEADHWCKLSHQNEISKTHIEKALLTRKQRNASLSESVLKDILDGNMRIASDGFACGQVNGLSILQVGETKFGNPMRITATVHPGSQGVIDIEREVELGQAVHSKGILLLAGFLNSRFAKTCPLAISAHIAIEQSYGYIDGDSASAAECCALLSALIDLPLRQDLAITGSMSQLGEVQTIGGVNEKIEGFFELCAARGLTGQQGVIIPATNQVNLMLSERVINAVKKSTFHIYCVSCIDEVMELLSGVSMGRTNAAGSFSGDSIGHKIVNQLKSYAKITAKNN